MLKLDVTYTDFDDNEQTDTLHFHLAKSDMVDLMDLLPRLEAWQAIIQGETRELTTAEIREMLDIIKILIEQSYGIRSEDGKRFRKSPEIFQDFKDSAAYDSFLFSLFQNLEMGLSFMTGILPKDLVDNDMIEKAKAAMAAGSVAAVQDVPMPDEIATIGGEHNATVKEVPAYERENREPTRAELAKMSPEELQAAFRRKIAAE